MALENGADLVVELPFLVSVQAADFFGHELWISWLGWVLITSLLGQKKFLDYQKCWLIHRVGCWDGTICRKICHLSPIPRNPSHVEGICWSWFSGNTPNHVLALAYAKAAAKANNLHPIQSGLVTILSTRMWTLPRGQPWVSAPEGPRLLRTLFMPSAALFEQASTDLAPIFAPLSNLIKSRPNHHLSGQSRNGCAY